jgi:hypothetical protein
MSTRYGWLAWVGAGVGWVVLTWVVVWATLDAASAAIARGDAAAPQGIQWAQVYLAGAIFSLPGVALVVVGLRKRGRKG